VARSQIQWQEVKETTGKLGNGQLLSGCGFVQNIATPSLSRDRGIKDGTKQNKQRKMTLRVDFTQRLLP